MKLLVISALAAAACVVSVPGFSVHKAGAAECTGENCPPPPAGGHDCHHDKEQTTS